MTQIGSYFVCFCGDIGDFNFIHSVERRMDCHIMELFNYTSIRGIVIHLSIFIVLYMHMDNWIYREYTMHIEFMKL